MYFLFHMIASLRSSKEVNTVPTQPQLGMSTSSKPLNAKQTNLSLRKSRSRSRTKLRLLQLTISNRCWLYVQVIAQRCVHDG